MLSVILPAFNEEKNIAETIKEVSDFLLKQKIDYEIIAVDDGSRDKTGEVLKECLSGDRRLVVITHPENIGYGAALCSGFEKSRGDLIFFTDSDRQFDIQELSVFLEKIKNNDFVVGFRKKRQDPFHRLVYAFLFRIIAWAFFDISVKDVDCAFKLFKKEVIEKASFVSKGALINLEIFTYAKRKGCKFVQVPVRHFPRKRGAQTGGSVKVLAKALFNLFSLWSRIYRNDLRNLALVLSVAFFSVSLTYLLSFFSFLVFQNNFQTLQDIWLRWDGYHYLTIAESWYQNTGPNQFLIVFFPLYPLLIRAFAIIFKNNFLSAILVSNFGYIFALIYLFKLTLVDFSKKTAFRAILYFSFFPAAYFLHAPYTEGLFTALLISSFYYARKEKWTLACLLTAFTTATRLTGLVLLPALFFEYLQQRKFRVKKDALWFLITPLGFVYYLLLNFSIYGKAFAFKAIMAEHWFKKFSWPWYSIRETLRGFSSWPWSGKVMISGAETFFIFLALLILIIGIRKVRPSYSLFGFLTLFMITSTSFLLSSPRYILTIFPIFVILAFLFEKKNEVFNAMVLAAFVVFYTLFLSVFAQGYWAF